MESPNNLSNSQVFPSSEGGGRNSYSPGAAEAECETVAMIKEHALLVAEDQQLKSVEFEGAASEEATLPEEEMENKMETELNNDSTESDVQGESELLLHMCRMCVYM